MYSVLLARLLFGVGLLLLGYGYQMTRPSEDSAITKKVALKKGIRFMILGFVVIALVAVQLHGL
jgi:hypothetical protein